jgi:hypothetical protein
MMYRLVTQERNDWAASDLIFLISELAFCFQNFYVPLKKLETIVYAQDYPVLKSMLSKAMYSRLCSQPTRTCRSRRC